MNEASRDCSRIRWLHELIVGESDVTRRVRSLVAKVAPSDLPVLIQGPSGSGKEVVAQALHRLSGRSGQLVTFNVCAIADTMFEDALFGHIKGAFTGAFADSPGYLAEANGGTVFLDEIGDLSLAMQAKLLRAIETKQYRAVGARLDRRSDFRVVAATNASLVHRVGNGEFRSDLFHRLGGVIIHLLPLAQRRADIGPLARHFARMLAGEGRRSVRLDDDALDALACYAWPGNVRELRTVIETAMIFAEDGVVDGETIRSILGSRQAMHSSAVPAPEREALLALLVECQGDTARVARELSCNRATVYRRLAQLGIPTPKRGSSAGGGMGVVAGGRRGW